MWNDLNMRDRHKFIKLAVTNGVYDLDTIHSLYDNNEYKDGGKLNTYAMGGSPNLDYDPTQVPSTRPDIHNFPTKKDTGKRHYEAALATSNPEAVGVKAYNIAKNAGFTDEQAYEYVYDAVTNANKTLWNPVDDSSKNKNLSTKTQEYISEEYVPPIDNYSPIDHGEFTKEPLNYYETIPIDLETGEQKIARLYRDMKHKYPEIASAIDIGGAFFYPLGIMDAGMAMDNIKNPKVENSYSDYLDLLGFIPTGKAVKTLATKQATKATNELADLARRKYISNIKRKRLESGIKNNVTVVKLLPYFALETPNYISDTKDVIDKYNTNFALGGDLPTDPNRPIIDTQPIIDKMRANNLAKYAMRDSALQQIQDLTNKMYEEEIKRRTMEWLNPSNYTDKGDMVNALRVPVAEARPTFINTYEIGGIVDNRKRNNKKKEEFEQMKIIKNEISPDNDEIINVDNNHEWKRTHWGEYDKAPTGNKNYGDVYSILRPEEYNTAKKKVELKQQIREEFPNAKIRENRPYLFKKYLFGENRGKYKPLYITGFRVPGGKWIDENPRLEFPKIEYTMPEIAKVPITYDLVSGLENINNINNSWEQKYQEEKQKEEIRQKNTIIPERETPISELKWFDTWYNNNREKIEKELEEEILRNKYFVEQNIYFEPSGRSMRDNEDYKKALNEINYFRRNNKNIFDTQANYNKGDIEEIKSYTPYGTPIGHYHSFDFPNIYDQLTKDKDLKEYVFETIDGGTPRFNNFAKYLADKQIEYIEKNKNKLRTPTLSSNIVDYGTFFPFTKDTFHGFTAPGVSIIHTGNGEPEHIEKTITGIDDAGNEYEEKVIVPNPKYKEELKFKTRERKRYGFTTSEELPYQKTVDKLFKVHNEYPEAVENSEEAKQLKKDYNVKDLDTARKINTLIRARIFENENGMFTTPTNVDSNVRKMTQQEFLDLFKDITIPGFNPKNVDVNKIKKYLLLLANNDKNEIQDNEQSFI